MYVACVAGGIRERARGGAAISSHGFATRVNGFATKTKALAREIPSATQACLYVQGVLCIR